METKTKTPVFILKLAAKIFAFYGKQWEAYESDCEDWAEQGYRPAHCFHGTNLWTDYDPMCGPCEDGYSWFDPMLYRQLALAEAKAVYAEFDERLSLYIKASTKHAPMDYGKMILWVSEPLTKWDVKPESKEIQARIDPWNPPF
jgi:hypothetical protein